MADGLREDGRLEIATKGERILTSFCFYYDELAVRLTKRGEIHEA